MKFNTSFTALSGILAILIIGACEKLYFDEPELTLTTERDSYVRGDTVRISINNPMEISVYVRRCGAQNFRYAIRDVAAAFDSPFRIDQCSSFNQSRVEVPRRGSLEIAFVLTFPTDAIPDTTARYRIYLNMSDVFAADPSPIPAITNPFQIRP